jgi:HlyD family secretion protein
VLCQSDDVDFEWIRQTPELPVDQAATMPPAPQVPASNRVPSIIVAVVIAAVAALSIYYLVRGQPLLVQGEVDATRFDIASRVDGRVGEIRVRRGENVAANAVLVRIDNPETMAKHEQALAAKVVADAHLANINVGTRVEVIASRKAALERAQAGPQDLRTNPVRRLERTYDKDIVRAK